MTRDTKSTINDKQWYDETVHRIAKYLLKGTQYFNQFNQDLEYVDPKFYANLRDFLRVIVVEGTIPTKAIFENRVQEYAVRMAREMDKQVATELSQTNMPSREIRKNKANTYYLQTRMLFCDVKKIGVADIVPPELLG